MISSAIFIPFHFSYCLYPLLVVMLLKVSFASFFQSHITAELEPSLPSSFRFLFRSIIFLCLDFCVPQNFPSGKFLSFFFQLPQFLFYFLAKGGTQILRCFRRLIETAVLYCLIFFPDRQFFFYQFHQLISQFQFSWFPCLYLCYEILKPSTLTFLPS